MANPITLDDRRKAFRYTTIHSRYHVACLVDDTHCDTEFAGNMEEAREVARYFLRQEGVTSVEIFDSMAHKGKPELWETKGHDGSFWRVVRKRPR